MDIKLKLEIFNEEELNFLHSLNYTETIKVTASRTKLMHKTKRHLSVNCKILQALIFSEMQIEPEQNLPFHICQILARYYKLGHAWFVSMYALFKEAYNDLFYKVSKNKIRLIS